MGQKDSHKRGVLVKREHIWIHHEQDANSFWKLAEGGYANQMSIRQGEEVSFHISNSRSYYDIFIFREGARRELVRMIGDLRGGLQPVPEIGYQDGFGWRPVTSFKIPDDWKSGVYVATFPTAQGIREILFVVRPKAPQSPMLLTIEANTYAAYNNVGGKCFFNYLSTDHQHAKLLSFERPLQPDIMGNFYIWDQFFTSWLDAEGYAADYCVNADHDAEPNLLGDYRANLRIGHGEYISRNECEQLQAFVASGGNLVLFAGNSFWHEVEIRNSGKQILCNKTRYNEAPLDKSNTSFLNSIDDLRQRTIGVYYTSCVHAKTRVPGVYDAPTTGEYGFFRVTEPDHWAFEGTGLKAGDEFGREDSIVGVECDAADIESVNGKPRYTGSDGVSPHYKIIAIADAGGEALNRELGISTGDGKGESHFFATVAINESQFKGTVFNAATIEWGHGLYRDDSVVAQITRNVLNQLACRPAERVAASKHTS